MPNVPRQFQTNGPDFGDQPGNPAGYRAIWWFKVQSTIDDPPAGFVLVKARTWNGSVKGAKDYIISLASAKGVDDTFYATKPEGGTGAKYGTPAQKVVWMEVAGGSPPFWAQVTSRIEPSPGDPNATYQYEWTKTIPNSTGFTNLGGDAGTIANGRFAASYTDLNGQRIKIDVGTNVLLLPSGAAAPAAAYIIITFHVPKKSAFAFPQQMDAGGAIDTDFLKGHA